MLADNGLMMHHRQRPLNEYRQRFDLLRIGRIDRRPGIQASRLCDIHAEIG